MMLLGLLSVVSVWGCVCSGTPHCSYHGLLKHLGVSENTNATLAHMRPVWNWFQPTQAFIQLYIQGIIEVNEKAQSFSPQMYLAMGWVNEFTTWNPADFCGITQIAVPKEKIWTPDLTIIENIKTEPGMKESPYAKLYANGVVHTDDRYRMTSSCKMDLHKFPFDTQSCTLTLLSDTYNIEELHLIPFSNTSTVTENSRKIYQSQGEWDLVGVDISRVNHTTGGFVWDTVVYTFIIRRRPLLYVVIFLVPVLYFLVLDLASFFISESGGEKLSFKVTVLLAISVLLLILHDMLPSTDENMPLIGSYCVGIFTFVALSLLEAIFVSFLLRVRTDGPVGSSEKPADQTDSQQDTGLGVLSVVPVSDGDQPSTVRLLRQILKELQLQGDHTHTSSADTPLTGVKRVCVCVRKVAKCIHVVYFICYLLSVTVFLLLMGQQWFF